MPQTCELTAESEQFARTPAVLTLSEQRRQAIGVLQSLLEAKSACDLHATEFKRSDLFRVVTGRSSLDDAITSTRRMIDQIDRQLGLQVRGLSDEAPRLVVKTSC